MPWSSLQASKLGFSRFFNVVRLVRALMEHVRTILLGLYLDVASFSVKFEHQRVSEYAD